MKIHSSVLLVLLGVCRISAFSSGDDKFLKKYAMMKTSQIHMEVTFHTSKVEAESWEVPTLLRQPHVIGYEPVGDLPRARDPQTLRTWLEKLAIARTPTDKLFRKICKRIVYESCFGQDVVKEVRMEMKVAASKCAGITPSAPGAMAPPIKLHGPPMQLQQQQPHQSAVQHQSQAHHVDGRIPATHGEHQQPQKIKDRLSETVSLHESESPQKQPGTLDLEKLQQAIMAGYNKQTAPQTYVQHQPYIPQPQQHLRPYQPVQPYQPAPVHNVYYPGYQPQPPYMQNPYPAYPQPMYQPGVYPTYYQGRSSRDLDVRGQLETLSNRVSGRIRNVTCVMQELGYLDANLDPDYGRMIERIGRLPVSEELKKDMAEGVDFCRQFSQCVPDDRKDKFIQEMVRPMFFFRCYKHKKLEACIMKDVRERYNSSEDLTEDNLATDSRAAKEFPEENMATAIYEFLYGGDNIDIDTLL